MSSDAVKKRKSKVLRGEAATPEVKRGRVEGEPQVWRNGRTQAELLRGVCFCVCKVTRRRASASLVFGGFRINIACFFTDQDVRVYSEEVELDSRDAEQDYKQFKESCESLANLMSEIQNLKANGAKEGVRRMHAEKKENFQTSLL